MRQRLSVPASGIAGGPAQKQKYDYKPIHPMKKHLVLIAILLLTLCVGCSESPEMESHPNAGANGNDWVSLFDGKSLEGWRGFNGVEIEGIWIVEEGSLHLVGREKGSPHVNIITESKYDDFDLRFEWKVEKGTNSGVMFHVGEGPKQPYLTGPEYQVLDNFGFRSGKGLPVGPKEHTASHYSIEPAVSDETKPIGEWNASRIVVDGDHVEYWLNEVKTAEYVMHSSQWKEQVANSKFKKWEHFATLGEGHIGLQDHGHRVWFRNLRIKEL